MTDLEMFNIALSLFDKEITQEDLDSNSPIKEVRLCKRYKNIAIVKTLREFDWSFLTVQLDVDYTDDVPGFGFNHGYKLPLDLFKIVNRYVDYTYEVHVDRIYTNTKDPIVYGIKKEIPSNDIIPLDYYELIAYAIAFQIAPLITSQEKVSSLILQKYSWVFNGLISAECHNNSKESNLNV